MMEKRRLKFQSKMICFQENPFEVNLSYSVSGCIRRCPGCHSSFLWDDIGDYVEDVIQKDIDENKDGITCVLFMGGDDDAHIDNLIDCALIAKRNGLKTCLYTGATFVDDNILQYFDYIKIGPYIKELGPLKSKTTNQRFYKVCDGNLEDVTYIFQN